MINYKLFVFLILFSLSQPILASSTSEVFEKASPSVYYILAKDDDNKDVGQGSAVAVTENILATNCHVATMGSKFYLITSENTYLAFVRYNHKDKDLCLFSVANLKLNPVSIRTSRSVKVGEDVVAIGNPMGLKKTISRGIISNKHKYKDGNYILQSDASISPGSSGGGLFDKDGKLIGLTTEKSIEGESLNFSIPSDWINIALGGAPIESLDDNRPKIFDNKKPSIKVKPKQQTVSSAINKGVKGFGRYGKDQIAVYKIDNDCTMAIPGRNEQGEIISTAMWSPVYPNLIVLYPRYTNIYDIYEYIYNMKKYKLTYKTYSYIFIDDGMYELGGRHNNEFYIAMFHKFPKPLTNLLMEGDYFIAQTKNQGYYQKIIYGLYGFSAGYAALKTLCQ